MYECTIDPAASAAKRIRIVSILRHWLIMAVLSFSGGIIFMLPFLQEVYYIPLAQALNLTNTHVGR